MTVLKGRRSDAEPGWRRWIGLIVVTGLYVVVSYAVAAWNMAHDLRVAADLRRDGVEVPVQTFEVRRQWKLANVIGNTAEVTFETTSGQPVETVITYAAGPTRGPTYVRYRPDDPHVARLANDLAPRATGLLTLVIADVVLALVGLGLYAAFRAIDRSLGVGER